MQTNQFLAKLNIGYTIGIKNLISIYTLQELISKTYRRAKFEFRGRYTGLKDKNGKEIYEGDIIKSLCQVFLEDDQDALISEVYYHESYAAFYLLSSNRDYENDGYEIDESLEQFIHNYDILEVIGNIYENPELLEKIE